MSETEKENRAATVIQSAWRSYRARKEYLRTKKILDKRRHPAMEILSTEESYTYHIGMLVHFLYKPLLKLAEKGKIELSTKEINSIFNNVEQIYFINMQFLLALRELFTDWSPAFSVGTTLIKHIPTFKMYMQYFKNFKSAQDNIKLYLSKHRRFKKFCSEPTSSAFEEVSSGKFVFLGKEMQFDPQPVENYLIMPIQRIPRYKMLIEALLKNTSKDFRDYKYLEKSMELMTEVCYLLDYNAKPRKDDTTRLWQIAQSIKGYPGEFLRKQRQFFLQADVRKHTDSSKAHTLFLFGDCIVSTIAGSGHSYEFKEEILLDDLEVVRIGEVFGEDVTLSHSPSNKNSTTKEKKKNSEQKKYPHLLMLLSPTTTQLFSFNDSSDQKSVEIRDDWYLRLEMLLHRIRDRKTRVRQAKSTRFSGSISVARSSSNAHTLGSPSANSRITSTSLYSSHSPRDSMNDEDDDENQIPCTRLNVSLCTYSMHVPKNTKLWKALLPDEKVDWKQLEADQEAESKRRKEEKKEKERTKSQPPTPQATPIGRSSTVNAEKMTLPQSAPPSPLGLGGSAVDVSSHIALVKQQLQSQVRQSMAVPSPRTPMHSMPNSPQAGTLKAPRSQSVYISSSSVTGVSDGLKTRFMAIEKQISKVLGNSEKGETERLKSQQEILDRMVKDAAEFEKEGDKELATQQKLKEQAKQAARMSMAVRLKPTQQGLSPQPTVSFHQAQKPLVSAETASPQPIVPQAPQLEIEEEPAPKVDVGTPVTSLNVISGPTSQDSGTPTHAFAGVAAAAEVNEAALKEEERLRQEEEDRLQQEENERLRKEKEERQRAEEEEVRKRQEEEEARKRQEEEERKRREEEERVANEKAEEERIQREAEETQKLEDERMKQEENERLRQEEEERQRAEAERIQTEADRKAEEDIISHENAIKAENQRKEEEERIAREKAEEEERIQKEEQDRLQREKEALLLKEAEEKKRREEEQERREEEERAKQEEEKRVQKEATIEREAESRKSSGSLTPLRINPTQSSQSLTPNTPTSQSDPARPPYTPSGRLSGIFPRIPPSKQEWTSSSSGSFVFEEMAEVATHSFIDRSDKWWEL
ncbi:putative RhoGEF domain containing protein [Blattamonas nauphoetae]|uniref:RhoGEF domain containing protein n=1 Tax=Blattamonas nauphoetae TaxID=2049346 RepID=A0ABQ9XFW1_9EUKA|nr:putative RhoGEF domain containing protein [Blattamonas nauphoetae]